MNIIQKYQHIGLQYILASFSFFKLKDLPRAMTVNKLSYVFVRQWF